MKLTKPSQVLREALKHYDHDSFMCHVLSDVFMPIVGYDLINETKQSFEFILTHNITLQGYLRRHDVEYADAYHKALACAPENWSPFSELELYALRVKWWEALIADLESEGR